MRKFKLSYFFLISLLVIVTALMSVALVACNKQNPESPITGEEAGVYYYDAGADEYTVVLQEGTQFTLAIAGVSRAGSYSLDGEVLTLMSNNNEGQISAIIKDNVITLTFNEAEYRFLKKINYTVTFNSNEGSAVNSATVINGKKVAKPADPTRNGYIFVGWYTDAEFGNPFSFNSQIITADTTVYARWVEKQVGGVEFVVDFNADNGGDNPESKMTIGGKLFDLPVVERENYTFKGWWVSMSGDDRLSYEATDGMTVDADTTLHALWQSDNLGTKLADPLVNVDANSIRWNNVGAREYLLQMKAPDGNYIVNKSLGGTVESITFDNYPAGDYIITVTAVATTGEANNAVVTRLYKNKAIARVSKFTVIEPSILLFNAVENAEKYLITVDCGDKNHNHVNFDNGTSTNFNFADCMMQNSGIKFTVTAVANGYASSVSKQFVYAPTLDAVSEFSLDEQTQKLVWNKIDNATGYMVSVNGNDFVNVGSENSISLKEFAKGEIVIKVYPVSKLYISPSVATYTYNKQNIATPQNIRISGTVVSWDEVAGANSYDVRIAGKTVSTDTNSVDLAGKVTLTEKTEYAFTVVAKGNNDSLPTDPIDARNLAMSDALRYENNVLYWTYVIGAAFYDVQVNDEPVFSVSDGSNFANINLTKAGENTLKVRFVDGTGSAFEWVTTKVYAHTLTFVSDGGSSIDEQYKAVGDTVVLPTPQKVGYDFLDWYNTPKGPESNGAAYKDSTFVSTGDVVLYACYTAKKYTVNYNYGDGGNGVQVSGDVYYQKDYQLVVPEANDATSAFGGWFSAPNGNGVQFTDDKGNSLNPWNRTDGADVYAFWFDDVLNFTLTTNAGRQVYAVMQGSRISQVSEVTIPQTYKGIKVGMIAGNAFLNCSNLVTLNIPSTVDVISTVDPFTGCTSLSAINVYEVEGNTTARYWSADGVLFDNGADTAAPRAQISYMPLGKTGSYTIPDGIVEIPSLAFANSALTRVVIPASVTRIGVEAFKGSLSLESVVFDVGSSQALTILDGAFASCESLTSITLPTRLSSIALTKYELLSASGSPASQTVSTDTGVTNAFVGCKNLKNIYIASGNKAYKSDNGIIYSADGTTLLYCLPTVEGELEIAAGVRTIADGAFIGCTKITDVTIANTVTTVGECAFYKTYLETVTFKGGYAFDEVTIGKYAFRACSDLAQVTFEAGNKVAYIGVGAFYGCNDSYFTTIELPENLKSVGAQAFRDCSYLKNITIASTSQELTFGSDAFYNCSKIETISLPKNVSQLPGVFSGCTSLKEVTVDPDNPYFTSENGILYDKDITTILFYPSNNTTTNLVLPSTVTTISDGVFRGNSKIKSVTIGKNVTVIGDGAFRDCPYLGEIIFEDSDSSATATTLDIGAYAFYSAGSYSSSISIVLPERTRNVGEYAFAEMSYLNSITLNEGLSAISDYMFYNAKRITAIEIPSTVKTIGVSAFYNCGYMPDIFVVSFADNSQLVSIGESAFYRTWSTKSDKRSVELPEGLQYIGYQAFYYSQFEEITIPSTVKIIEAEAFASNSYLKTVTFTSGGTDDLILGAQYVDGSGRVYEGAVFKGCGMQEIVLPERLAFIGSETFSGCSSLTSVSFGENSRLKHIGEEVFYNTKLASLTIPKSVANGYVTVDANGTKEFRIGIADKAFYGIHTLDVVNFEDGGTEPLSLGDGAFYYMNGLVTVNLPARIADCTVDGVAIRGITHSVFADSWLSTSSNSVLEAINISAGNAYYCSVDGVVYTADMTTIVACPENKTGTVTVDSRVKLIESQAFARAKISEIIFEGGNTDMVIDEYAFYGCKSLEEVVLSDNVVEVKDGAFAYCTALVKITLSAKMSTYNPNVFTGTTLREIVISANNKDFTSQNGIVFSKDMKTLVLYPSTVEETSYVIPAGVTAISANAFSGNTYLQSLTLPSGLKEIGEYAFYGCANLADVTIPNSVETIGSNAFTNCTSLGELKFEKGGSSLLVIETYAFQNSGITAIEIPARLTALSAYAFNNCKILSKVTFENGSHLDSIGERAFNACASLKTIALPQGLNVIGDSVFVSCTELTSVSFGEGLIEIGNYTFSKCSSLETVNFPASLQKMGIGTFADSDGYNNVKCSSLKSVSFAQGSQLTMLPEATFYNCTALERFTVPASVTVIENMLWDDDYSQPVNGHYGVFQGCTSLKSVVFEEGSKCNEIGNYAFHGCVSLEAFTIPTAVSRLGIRAFYNCESIVEIVIPATATIYGKELFSGCKSLSRVTLNEKATALPDGMFSNCVSLKQLNIPASVTSIGGSLLSNTGFETFVVPSNIKELPSSFLSNCKSLVSVELSNGLTQIGNYAFSYCSALRNIEIPATVTTIGDYAFQYCTALSNISISANLENIGRYAFAYDSSLTSIKVPSKVTDIGDYAFRDCYKLVEVINCSSLDLNKNPYTYLTAYATSILTEGDESIIMTTPDGFQLLADGDYVKVLGYVGTATQIVLPSNTSSIYEYAFAGCSFVSITIPASVTVISDYAFQGCANLTTVIMEGNVLTIGQYSFAECVNLTTVSIPDSVTSIGSRAFESCTSLANIKLPASLITLGSYAFRYCEKLQSIVIPDGVSRLEASVFYGCTELRTAVLPASLSYINESYFAFEDCLSLESYAINGSSNEYYKTVDGALYNFSGKTLISVPAMKTGIFIIPKEVTSINSAAFKGSNLDMIKFEEGRDSKLSLSYSAYWLQYATVKSIVISMETVSSVSSSPFGNWTSEQTIYFVDSLADLESKYVWYESYERYTNANIVYGYAG